MVYKNKQQDTTSVLDLIRRRATVLMYLVRTSGGLRDPILLYTFVSSLARSAMIFSINETARTLDEGIGWSVAALFASAILMLTAGYHFRVRAHLLIIKIRSRLRRDMTQKLVRADTDYLLSRPHGEVYAVVTTETNILSNAVIRIIESFEAVVLIVIVVPYLFWISPSAGFATLVALAIGTAGYMYLDRPARRSMLVAARANAEFASRVQDMLGGWKEIRLRNARRRAVEKEANDSIESYNAAIVKSERLYAASTMAGESAVVLLMCFVVAVVPLIQGGGAETAFQVLTVIYLTSGPITTMFDVLPQLSRAEAAHSRITLVENDLVRAQSTQTERDRSPFQSFETLQLEGVTAIVRSVNAPAAEAFQLGPIDLEFRPGETVFICGGNGSGKTTLLSIITGMRHPDKGHIVLDGQTVEPQDMGAYRELFSGVFSDFHLFDKTFGMAEEEVAEMERRIEELHLSDRVSVHEDRFSTLSLSSGQRRRLALSIALAERRPIIILDEFAADQDPANRAFFYDVLVPELTASGRLVLAVTHDEHQFDKCDRLIKMSAGKVISDERVERSKRSGVA